MILVFILPSFGRRLFQSLFPENDYLPPNLIDSSSHIVSQEKGKFLFVDLSRTKDKSLQKSIMPSWRLHIRPFWILPPITLSKRLEVRLLG
jgi:hypothetical protein